MCPADPLPASDLSALRQRIDAIDSALHRLIIERAGLIPDVIAAKRMAGDVSTGFRPAREAAILRRLVAQHSGDFPVTALVQIWRELLAGSNAMQAGVTVGFTIAVPAVDRFCRDLARDHFGSSAAIEPAADTVAALDRVRAGTAAVAVLPAPGAAADGWWPPLMDEPADRPLRIVARLPFLPTARWRHAGAPTAVTVARVAPEPTGSDHSLIGLEIAGTETAETLTARLTGAGLPPVATPPRVADRDDAPRRALIIVDGHVTADDPRLATLSPAGIARAVPLGGYALPLPETTD